MSARRIWALIAAVTLAAAGALAGAPAAGAAPAPDRGWWQPAPYTYYLSLGDSLGFGFSNANFEAFKAAVAGGASPEAAAAAAFQGYTQQVAAQLGLSGAAAANLSCPEETTSSMLSGPCPASTLFAAWPYGTAPQISVADAFLARHTGERGVITLSIGADDVLGAIESAPTCLTNPTCPQLTTAVMTAANNLKTILRDLHGAAPRATIVVLTPYNPFGEADPVSNIAAVGFNLTIAWTALINGARVADAFGPINVQHRNDFDCGTLVYYCANPANLDVHPTLAGYGVIAGAVEAALR